MSLDALKNLPRKLLDRVDIRFRALVKHFFNAFFDVEIIHPTAESRLGVGHILALLSVPGMLMSFGLYGKYLDIAVGIFRGRIKPDQWDVAVWNDKCFYLFYAAAFMGFVTVFQWDTLFLNKRDWMVFGGLPLKTRTILGAKASALAIYLCVFALSINGAAMMIFPSAVEKPPGLGPWPAVPFAVHHIVSILAVCAFMFLLLISLQGLLMNVLPARLFRRVSPVAQFFCLMAMLSMLLMFPKIASMLQPLKPVRNALVYYLPPMWFLGWTEAARGRPEPVFAELAAIAWPAFFSAFAFAAAMYLLSYYRHVKRSLEVSSDASSEPSVFDRAFESLANSVLVRNQTERAVFFFTLKTTLRSRRHWLIFSAYAGVGVSLALNALLLMLSKRGYGAVQQVNSGILSMPLILTFFLLAGLRFIFTIPAELGANWVFKLSATADPLRYLWAIRKAMIVLAGLPVLLPLIAVHSLLWDLGLSVYHFLFCLALTWLVMEVLLLKFQKIPFTCSYLPGKANLPFFGALYFAAFLTYITAMAEIEFRLLTYQNWGPLWRMWLFYVLAGAGALYMVKSRNHSLLEPGNGFTFEDPPELAVTTLNLAG